MATTVNIVLSDTLANLQAGQPYGSDYYFQLLINTDDGTVWRVNSAGNIDQLSIEPTRIEVLNHTGATVPVTGLSTSSTILNLYRDGIRKGSLNYTLGTNEFTPLEYDGAAYTAEASDDESWYIEFK